MALLSWGGLSRHGGRVLRAVLLRRGQRLQPPLTSSSSTRQPTGIATTPTITCPAPSPQHAIGRRHTRGHRIHDRRAVHAAARCNDARIGRALRLVSEARSRRSDRWCCCYARRRRPLDNWASYLRRACAFPILVIVRRPTRAGWLTSMVLLERVSPIVYPRTETHASRGPAAATGALHDLSATSHSLAANGTVGLPRTAAVELAMF